MKDCNIHNEMRSKQERWSCTAGALGVATLGNRDGGGGVGVDAERTSREEEQGQ